MTAIAIRTERPGDEGAIGEVIEAAFAGHEHSDGSEPAIVDRLRAEGDLALSLVAEEGGALVGHVAFSPVTISDGTDGWLALGPLAVRPDCQRRGIGRALTEAGLAQLCASGAKGIVVVGEPKFYGRFGFTGTNGLSTGGPLDAYLQALAFDRLVPEARVRFAPAFEMPEPGA